MCTHESSKNIFTSYIVQYFNKTISINHGTWIIEYYSCNHSGNSQNFSLSHFSNNGNLGWAETYFSLNFRNYGYLPHIFKDVLPLWCWLTCYALTTKRCILCFTGNKVKTGENAHYARWKRMCRNLVLVLMCYWLLLGLKDASFNSSPILRRSPVCPSNGAVYTFHICEFSHEHSLFVLTFKIFNKGVPYYLNSVNHENLAENHPRKVICSPGVLFTVQKLDF